MIWDWLIIILGIAALIYYGVRAVLDAKRRAKHPGDS